MTTSSQFANHELVVRCWEIPLLPPSLNRWQSMHWAERKRIKDEWYGFAWGLMNQRDTAVPVRRPWVYVEAELLYRTAARRDADNFEATLWKITGDALQTVGVIEDDQAAWFRRGPVRHAVDRTLQGRGRHPGQPGLTRLAIVAPA